MKRPPLILAAVLAICTSLFAGPSRKVLAQSTKVALHATQEEIDIWRQRTQSGPYLDEWNRITSRANGFKASPNPSWAGQTVDSCWLGDPSPARNQDEGLRDAAFVYMLTRDTSYSSPVRTRLLNQAATTGTDFTNSIRWCLNDEMNNVIDLGPWLRRLVYAYDYIKPTLLPGDKTTLDAWFLGAAKYLNAKLDRRVKKCFPNYRSDDWSVVCGSGNTDVTHRNGWMTQNHMNVFGNQEGSGMSAVAAIAVVLDDANLKASALQFVKGWLRVAVFPDGTAFDQYRWIRFATSPNPGTGYMYAATAIGSFVSAADHLQRAGESIYEFTTSEGVGNSVGGPKSIGLVVKRLAQMQQHLVDVYGSTNDTLTDCKRIDDTVSTSACPDYTTNHRIVLDMAPMAQSNVFYKDSTVAASYSRTAPSNPTSGGYDAFGGDWGNYSGARFMFGQMEGKVWPYSTAAIVSSPPLTPSTNPIGYWKFDEGSGTTASDSSGTGNHGILTNGANWSTGKSGNAVSLDGIDDFVKISTTNFLVSQGTLALWVRATSFASNPRYFFGHTSLPAFGSRIQLYADDIAGGLDFGFGDSHARALNIHQLQLNTWYHIGLTWGSGTYSVYVNGIQTSTGSYAGFTSLNSYAHVGGVGIDSKPESWSGAIDEVKVWNRALSSSEVQNEYSSYQKPQLQGPSDLVVQQR
jgi:hypothetical protein